MIRMYVKRCDTRVFLAGPSRPNGHGSMSRAVTCTRNVMGHTDWCWPSAHFNAHFDATSKKQRATKDGEREKQTSADITNRLTSNSTSTNINGNDDAFACRFNNNNNKIYWLFRNFSTASQYFQTISCCWLLCTFYQLSVRLSTALALCHWWQISFLYWKWCLFFYVISIGSLSIASLSVRWCVFCCNHVSQFLQEPSANDKSVLQTDWSYFNWRVLFTVWLVEGKTRHACLHSHLAPKE